MRAGRRTDMSCELEVVIWPLLRLARMRCERGSVVVVLPASPSTLLDQRRRLCGLSAWTSIG